MLNKIIDEKMLNDHDTVDPPYERPDPDLRNLFSEMRASKLIRMLAFNLAGGIVLATVAVGGLLYLDAGGLRRLIMADHSSLLSISLLLFGFIVTLGSFVMGTAIMTMRSDE